jgi:hypothetical protein
MRNKKTFVIKSLILGILFFFSEVQAKEVVVPRDYDRIQDAIDAAVAGDQVKVLAGIYSEIVTMKAGVDLLGEGADVTTIVALAEGPPTAVVTTADDAVLDGFTITGARGRPGHAVMVKDTSPGFPTTLFGITTTRESVFTTPSHSPSSKITVSITTAAPVSPTITALQPQLSGMKYT